MTGSFGIVALVAFGSLLLLALTLAVVNLVVDYRRLRAEAVPRPSFVLLRVIASLVPRPVPASLTPGERAALVEWDIRWVTAGRTLARVTGFEPATGAVELVLESPIELAATSTAPAVRLESVRFLPRRLAHAGYERQAVSGYLEPSIAPGLFATGRVVLYPDATALK